MENETETGKPGSAKKRWGLGCLGVAGLVVLGLVIIGACLSDPAATFAVDLTVAGDVRNGSAQVAGKTSLPDGAILTWILKGAVSQATGTLICSDGRFHVGEPVTKWEAGSAEFSVVFDPSDPGQPADLREACGDKGQHLRGSGVTRQGDTTVVKARLSLKIPEPPPTPQQIAVAVWGGPPTSAYASGITVASFEDGKLDILYRRYPLGSNVEWEFSIKMADLVKKVFPECREVSEIRVLVELPFSDAYGNTTWRRCIYARMTRETFSKVNWPNFLMDNMPRVCDDWVYSPKGGL